MAVVLLAPAATTDLNAISDDLRTSVVNVLASDALGAGERLSASPPWRYLTVGDDTPAMVEEGIDEELVENQLTVVVIYREMSVSEVAQHGGDENGGYLVARVQPMASVINQIFPIRESRYEEIRKALATGGLSLLRERYE